jgi:hypothetical protein
LWEQYQVFFTDAGQEASRDTVMLREEPVLVHEMLVYLYTSDYLVNPLFSVADTSNPSEAPATNALEAKDVFAEEDFLSQQLGGGGCKDNASQPDEALEHTPAAFDPLSFHILMYCLADRMLIEDLKSLSKQKAERELIHGLDANSFTRAILEIYNATPADDRGLRDMAVRVTMDHLTMLSTGDGAAPVTFQNSLLKSVPQFCFDLLVAIVDRKVSNQGSMVCLCKENRSTCSH